MANRRRKYVRRVKKVKDTETNNEPKAVKEPMPDTVVYLEGTAHEEDSGSSLTSSSSSSDSDSVEESDPEESVLVKVKRVRPRGKSYRCGYKVEVLKVAYNAVVNKGMSVYSASKKFNVPQSTLRDRVIGRVSQEVTQSGPPTIFTPDEEAAISSYVKLFAEIGCPLSRIQVRELSAEFARHLNRRDYAEGKSLSLRWYYKFISRFPETQTHRYTHQKLKALNYGYYKKLTSAYETLKDVSAKRIFSLDAVNVFVEDSCLVCEEFSDKGSKYGFSPRVTFIGCASVSGTKLPPCYVFRDENDALHAKIVGKIQTGAITKMSVTDVGNISNIVLNPTVLKDYFENHVNEHIKLKSKQYIMFYDDSRFTIPVTLWMWGQKNNLLFFPIPPLNDRRTPPLRATGCLYGLEKMFASERQIFIDESGREFSTSETCKTLNRSYQCLSATHLQQVFHSMGVFPLPENNPGLLEYEDLVDDDGKSMKPYVKTKKRPKKRANPRKSSQSPSASKRKIVSKNERKIEEDIEDCARVKSHAYNIDIKHEVSTDTTVAAATEFVDWTGLVTSDNVTEGQHLIMKTEPVHTVDHQYSSQYKDQAEQCLPSVSGGVNVDDCTYYVYLSQDNKEDAVTDSNMPVSVAEEVIITLTS